MVSASASDRPAEGHCRSAFRVIADVLESELVTRVRDLLRGGDESACCCEGVVIDVLAECG